METTGKGDGAAGAIVGTSGWVEPSAVSGAAVGSAVGVEATGDVGFTGSPGWVEPSAASGEAVLSTGGMETIGEGVESAGAVEGIPG